VLSAFLQHGFNHATVVGEIVDGPAGVEVG